MAPHTNYQPSDTTSEVRLRKANVSAEDVDSETLEIGKHLASGKPPRHVSAIRHCVSSAQLVSHSELVWNLVLYIDVLVNIIHL